MKQTLPKALFLLVVLSVMLAACIPDPVIPAVTPTQPVLPPTEAVEEPAAEAPAAAAPALGPAECKPGLSAIQPPTAEQAAMVAMIPPVNADDIVRGPADAAVTILEYSDYQ
jgi:hypothetical protein